MWTKNSGNKVSGVGWRRRRRARTTVNCYRPVRWASIRFIFTIFYLILFLLSIYSLAQILVSLCRDGMMMTHLPWSEHKADKDTHGEHNQEAGHLPLSPSHHNHPNSSSVIDNRLITRPLLVSVGAMSRGWPSSFPFCRHLSQTRLGSNMGCRSNAVVDDTREDDVGADVCIWKTSSTLLRLWCLFYRYLLSITMYGLPSCLYQADTFVLSLKVCNFSQLLLSVYLYRFTYFSMSLLSSSSEP